MLHLIVCYPFFSFFFFNRFWTRAYRRPVVEALPMLLFILTAMLPLIPIILLFSLFIEQKVMEFFDSSILQSIRLLSLANDQEVGQEFGVSSLVLKRWHVRTTTKTTKLAQICKEIRTYKIYVRFKTIPRSLMHCKYVRTKHLPTTKMLLSTSSYA